MEQDLTCLALRYITELTASGALTEFIRKGDLKVKNNEGEGMPPSPHPPCTAVRLH